MGTDLVKGVFNDPVNFEVNQRMAKALCASTLFPADFRKNIADALIVLEMAQRLGTSALMVAQQMYVVHGKPSWSSQYCIAAVNASGRFDSLKFQVTGEGDNKQCIAWARDKRGDRVEGPPVSIKMAKDEGWYNRTGSKWKTLSDLMLRYRAATFFARLYCPDLLMGMYTRDEVEDMGAGDQPAVVDIGVFEDALAARDEEPATTDAEVVENEAVGQ